ncbi:unnamed protein product [Triticum turgidum subsp. durum]|uniref:Uncharacterized protein n=1 Tax=Triticum turgidum subsp. durum TaxID=4567 RepID=A0A9R0W4Y8_TRITD|nr:unnamed protein product [Triticum turgidum subsp. durum]
MRTPSQCGLAGGCTHLPGPEGITTQARRRRRCLADTGSGRPGKRNPDGARARATGDPEATEWRDWASLTSVFVEDIAGRLLSVDVSEYLRFRAVCAPCLELTDDPRTGGVLDGWFRPRNWIPLRKQAPTPGVSASGTQLHNHQRPRRAGPPSVGSQPPPQCPRRPPRPLRQGHKRRPPPPPAHRRASRVPRHRQRAGPGRRPGRHGRVQVPVLRPRPRAAEWIRHRLPRLQHGVHQRRRRRVHLAADPPAPGERRGVAGPTRQAW